MVGNALGLVSSIAYGAADFMGGLASRRSSALSVVVISQAAGLVVLLLLLPFLPRGFPIRSDFIMGALSGLAGALGIVFLYRGLAIGRMSLVSPVTAVLGALTPLAVALLLHERPSRMALVGVALALIAVALVCASEHPEHEQSRRATIRLMGMPLGLPEAIISGIGIGLFLLLIARTGHQAGLWPLAAARLTSISLLGAVALVSGKSLRPQRGGLNPILIAGLLDVTGNALYLLATRYGLLSLIVVLASLYPATTVLLARVFLHERLTVVQLAGVVCAVVAVALIAGGSHA